MQHLDYLKVILPDLAQPLLNIRQRLSKALIKVNNKGR